MMGIIMAGGLGSRMGGRTEKLLLEYRKPVVLHVVDALRGSGAFSEVIAAVSPNAPRTAGILAEHGIRTVQTSGGGYSLDLGAMLSEAAGGVLVVPGDLPLLDAEIVRCVVSLYDPGREWTAVLVTGGFAGSLGIACNFPMMHGGTSCCYTGVSLVNADMVNGLKPVPQSYEICDDERIAFNLNTAKDYVMLQRRAMAPQSAGA